MNGEHSDQETPENANHMQDLHEDLAAAAQLGRALLLNNEQLHREHSETLELFRQHIHNLESERNLLQLKLDAVETDYEMQIKELQNNIINLRLDVQKQKDMYLKLENDRLNLIAELTQQNQMMSKKLASTAKNESRLKLEITSLRAQCHSRKSTIHENFQLLDSLRLEIKDLRDQKSKLETQLKAVTEDREQLFENLHSCRAEMEELRRVRSDQLETIQSQDQEIAYLQEKANSLQHHIHNLSSQSSSTPSRPTSSNSSTSATPHRSLLAELAEQRLELMPYAPFGVADEVNLPDDDDDVEMDDDALLTYALMRDDVQNGWNDEKIAIPSTSAEPLQTSDDSDANFLSDLRGEVAEIYQQMRRMCVEVQALQGVQPNANESSTHGGQQTPDELAMVEMDFRLSSLQSVLGDLRGLLRELIPEPKIVQDQKHVYPIVPAIWENPSPSKNTGTEERTEHIAYQNNADHVTAAMISERNALANEVATAHQQLLDMQRQIESEHAEGPISGLKSTKNSELTTHWQELDDEDYEFEEPR